MSQLAREPVREDADPLTTIISSTEQAPPEVAATQVPEGVRRRRMLATLRTGRVLVTGRYRELAGAPS